MNSVSRPKIQVVVGSIREGRAGIKVADWFMKAVEGQTEIEVELVDLKEYTLPLFVDAVSPSQREGVHSVPEVEAWLAKLKEADGYIFVTPEYNHSLPGAFKNALDYVYKEVHNKPLGIVSYGALPAGSRAAEHLRQIAAELHMFDVRDQILIPMVWAAFAEDGQLASHNDSQTVNAQNLLKQVAELALKLQK